MAKPRLTLAEAGYLAEVDADIRRHDRHPSTLEQAFSDLHDGNLYLREVRGLINKRLLRVVPVGDCLDACGCGDGLLGYGCGITVDFTDRAMRIFWPKLYAARTHRTDRRTLGAGGRARAAKLTPERRSEIARAAALARWRKETPDV